MKKILIVLFVFLQVTTTQAQEESVARQWNEMLLEAIRNDFARPTVHARNLFHVSGAMYDAWALFDSTAQPYLVGQTVNGFTCPLIEGFPDLAIDYTKEQVETAVTWAAHRVLKNRFLFSPGGIEILTKMDSLLESFGHRLSNNDIDYTGGDPASFGNYIGKCWLDYGAQDGSNENIDYNNLFYDPINPPLVMDLPGNPDLIDPNRWQPLTLELFIDQSGNPTGANTPEFLSPEWGQVLPFALTTDDLTIYQRDDFDYYVYHDPGPPVYLDTTAVGDLSEEYKWNFAVVSAWSSHLDPADSVMIDISPATVGNILFYPTDVTEFRNFYDLEFGGDPSRGHEINPSTGQAYAPNIVPRADYARVLAEFWADGPDSETPPGHWFTIMNYVHDHPDFERRYQGLGEELDELEWDVKAYFTLGGAMHDAAISAWGCKGWYDYIRPVSALRGLAEFGQSSDPDLPNYHPGGIILIPDFIELIEEGDSLVGENNEHLNKIKIKAWRGPDYIEDPAMDVAGVGWIRAEDWWPYQRPTFVTPPFAAYVSGHSTYSRAAAEVLTYLTGDPFFPGGLAEFYAPKNEFLVFERGPSVDVILQWATYQDASDQTSLSRIWGGIHPPIDDIPGRLIGEKVGVAAAEKANTYFVSGVTTSSEDLDLQQAKINILPVPFNEQIQLKINENKGGIVNIWNAIGQLMYQIEVNNNLQIIEVNTSFWPSGTYAVQVISGQGANLKSQKIVKP
ncbi:MAG: T9SS type A sorting domain-containing protein [Bacteroidota bacterium]